MSFSYRFPTLIRCIVTKSHTHTHTSIVFVCLFVCLFLGGFLLYRFQKENVFSLRERKKNRPQCHRLVYTYSSSRSSFSFNDIHSRPCPLCVCVHFQLDPLFFLFNLYENYIAFFFVNLIQIVVVFFPFQREGERKNKFKWGLTQFCFVFFKCFFKEKLTKIQHFKKYDVRTVWGGGGFEKQFDIH